MEISRNEDKRSTPKALSFPASPIGNSWSALQGREQGCGQMRESEMHRG